MSGTKHRYWHHACPEIVDDFLHDNEAVMRWVDIHPVVEAVGNVYTIRFVSRDQFSILLEEMGRVLGEVVTWYIWRQPELVKVGRRSLKEVFVPGEATVIIRKPG